ncbi:uncharacterized protein [Medicago truncatula]|uniref:uncharacterized protein n=1 Tax=Medicago truncatula TaxID=3880 RepID=UPI001967FA8D|nr:uncharacterized protein LOC120578143 [Medicago truncatula]
MIVVAIADRNARVAIRVGFGSFKHLKLSEYPDLKEFWYGRLEHKAFRSLKYLVVHKCDFLSDVLFKPNLVEVLMNLKELYVEDCDSSEAVFDLNDEFAKEIVVQNSSQLKKLKLSNLSKLRHVWKEDPHNTMRFQNLSDVSVVGCNSLISLFPFSVASDMMQLQSLQVSQCGIQEIVAKEEGTYEMVKFVFPHLTSINLEYLTKLKAFFVGVHSLQCKSLKTIKLFACPTIELFKAEPLRHQESSKNDVLNISTYQPLFVIEEVLAKLENLHLNKKDFGMILQSQHSGVQFNNIKHLAVCEFYNEEATFPYWFLKNVPNLERLLVQWSSFTELFQGEQIIRTEKEPEIIPRLRVKYLTLWHLTKLQCICKEGFQIDPVLQLLETICVSQCSSMIKLVPSSVTFSYMTYLKVTYCNGLINLISHSTAKSLVKLTTMKIKMCNWLEDIVNGKEDKINEISFCSLQYLELISLQRLCQFCSCPCPIMFPLLEVVVVKECPRMELFSLGFTKTTNLQNVQTDEGNHWEGDLNRTIKKMFCDKVAFGEFVYLAFSDYPELKDVWYGQLHCNVFCNLKHLVVERCDFLSHHIWNEDPHEIIGIGNLHKVDVSLCQSLLYVFPYTLCPDLGHLEMLEISSCGVKEIVAMEETGSMEINFNFPQLEVIRLYYLTNLKSFYQGNHTLDFPLLKTLSVYRCEALRMFSFNNSDLQVDENQDVLFQQPLFCIEKLSPNLEELAINGTNMLVILNGYCQENIFLKVKLLRLQCFDEIPTILLDDFHTIFPNVETFKVCNSSFETLFPTKGATSYLSMQTSNQIRKLWLFELDKLKHVWQEDFPLDHSLLQYLEELRVVNCPSLISLVPSSTSFTNLTYLKVDNCEELIYLIKISTAKSLVQLKALNITNCEKMLDVVKIDDDKAEENIVFENLEYLEFTSLSNLRSFCYGKQTFIFPSLLRFIFKGCPQMKIFSSALIVAPCVMP